MKAIVRAVSVALLLGSAVILCGCGESEKPAADVTVAPTGTQPTDQTQKGSGGGATPDMSVVPAPAGVKTGTGK